MAKKLKIVFLSKYFGSVSRGAETYVEELSKRLRKNHKVYILVGDDSYDLNKIVKGNYDLVIPTNGRTQALRASIGRLINGYKIIISGQSGIGKDDIWNILVTRPDAYVAITDYEKKWAKNWAFGVKLVTIPNGVDLEKFTPSRVKKDLKMERPIILSVGALEWYKHHERTIKALSHLKKESLLIIGSGSQKEKLEKLGKSLLGSRFKIEKVEFKDIPIFYRSADLFCLPSWDRESFGIVYLEAMASGLPVVAPDDLSRREIVGMGGIFVDVTDPEKYAKAINEALNKKWKNLPRKQAEKFSWDIVAEKYENLFKELFP